VIAAWLGAGIPSPTQRWERHLGDLVVGRPTAERNSNERRFVVWSDFDAATKAAAVVIASVVAVSLGRLVLTLVT